MNWLAHVYLAEPRLECQLGNLLADLVKGPARAALSAEFLNGVRHHQFIDGCTDSHPVVHRSRRRLAKPYRRFAGILVDIFYDHFLALHWESFHPQPLLDFTAQWYADIQAQPLPPLPASAQSAVAWMIAEDRLGSYQHFSGIEAALFGVSERLAARVGREFHLELAIGELQEHFDPLQDDFLEFFPQLQIQSAQWQSGRPMDQLTLWKSAVGA